MVASQNVEETMKQSRHWTLESPDDAEFSSKFDFLEQFTSMCRHKKLAYRKLLEKDEHPTVVSCWLKCCHILCLGIMHRMTAKTGLRLSVVVHDVPENEGPVSGEVFFRCWEAMGRPQDMGDFNERVKK